MADVSARRASGDGGAAKRDTCAIIAAGGLGLRFGDPNGKQYVELCGLPVLSWSVAAFCAAPSVAELVVVCPAGRIDETREAVERISPALPISYVCGGATRQDSCLAGLHAAPSELPFVAIHDGARPLIDVATIEAVIARVRDDASLDGAICAYPATDTLKLVEDGLVQSTPDRSRYWAVQTPQVFRLKAVLAAHEAAAAEGFVGTDDSSLVERAGGRVACVESPRNNIKITVPEDLPAAEAELARRGVQAAAPDNNRGLQAGLLRKHSAGPTADFSETLAAEDVSVQACLQPPSAGEGPQSAARKSPQGSTEETPC